MESLAQDSGVVQVRTSTRPRQHWGRSELWSWGPAESREMQDQGSYLSRVM